MKKTDENNSVQELAEILHDHCCTAKNTEFCGWYFVENPWSEPLEGYSKKYLAKAAALLKNCNGSLEKAKNIIKTIFGYV